MKNSHYSEFQRCHEAQRSSVPLGGPGRLPLWHFITLHEVYQWMMGLKSRRFFGTSDRILYPYCPSLCLILLPSFSPRPLPSSTPTALAPYPRNLWSDVMSLLESAGVECLHSHTGLHWTALPCGAGTRTGQESRDAFRL